MQYRTEIVIPADRYVCLQLPDFMPEGVATVTVHSADREDRHQARPEDEFEPQEIEWWDEFDGEDPRREGR